MRRSSCRTRSPIRSTSPSPAATTICRNAIRNASALAREEERPPPGTAGLIARARGDYGRILAALYAQGHYGGSVRILIAGVPVETLRPDAELPDPAPVSVSVEAGPLFHFGSVAIDGMPSEADEP